MQKMSIIVPCYNEEEVLTDFYTALKNQFKKIKNFQFETIFVNDGSKDNTLEIIKNLKKKDKTIRYVSFSRNFGKEAALYAGLKASKGDIVVTMDADMQDPPALLPEMLRAIQKEGFDSVATKRATRKGSHG